MELRHQPRTTRVTRQLSCLHEWYWHWALIICLFISPFVNGGGSGYWTRANVSISTIDYVSGVWSGDRTVYMVGHNDNSGAIVKSIDGGYTWSTVVSGTTSSTLMSDISTYGTYFFAVSLSGDVWVSSDSGNSFISIGSSVPAQLYGSAVGSNGNAFAVGMGKTTPYPSKVFRSSGGYTVWSEYTPRNPPTSNKAYTLLTAVSTADGNRVITVGYGGLIYYSSDGGLSWSWYQLPSSAALQCVSHGSIQQAMAAGDATTTNNIISVTLIKTTDGGATWTDISGGFSDEIYFKINSQTSFSFHALVMISTSLAYVSATSGIIIRTVDGGVTWTLDYESPIGAPSIFSIAFSRASNGMVGVAGLQRSDSPAYRGTAVVRSPDPSAAPTLAPTSQPASPTVKPTIYQQPSTRPTGRPTGRIGYPGTDVGMDTYYVWNRAYTGNLANVLQSIAYSKTDPMYVAGVGYYYSAGLIVYSNDGGNTWTQLTLKGQTALVPMKIQDVDSITDTQLNIVYLAVTNTGAVFYSDKAGQVTDWGWTQYLTLTAPQGVSVAAGTPLDLRGVAIGTNRQAYVVSYMAGLTGASAGAIYTAGVESYKEAWTDVSPLLMRSALFNAVGTYDGTVVVAVGDGGLIYYSNNIGTMPTPASWKFSDQVAKGVIVDASRHLYCVSFGSTLVAYAGGTYATLIKTTDGGQTWQSLYPALRTLDAVGINTDIKFHAISAVSSAVVYASASNGVIFRTINGGYSFTVEGNTQGSPAALYCIGMYRGVQRPDVVQTGPGVVGLAGDNSGYTYTKTFAPTAAPTPEPSPNPTVFGETNPPSTEPSLRPSRAPSTPTFEPSTEAPNWVPKPSLKPSYGPTPYPSKFPTYSPSPKPSTGPSYIPSFLPSALPSYTPTPRPSADPTLHPSPTPTVTPTIAEHRMYLPLVAIIAPLVLLFWRLSPTLALTILLPLTVVEAFATYQRNLTYHSAIDLWRDTVAKRPDQERAHLHLGDAYLAAGRTDEGIASLEKARSLAPQDAKIYNNLGLAYAHAGRNREALTVLEQAVKLAPNKTPVRLSFGNALLAAGRQAEAMAEFERAVALSPDNSQARFALANGFALAGRTAEAIQNYERALQSDPGDVEVLTNLGAALARAGRIDEAIARNETAVRLKPDSVKSHLNLGIAFLMANRRDQALAQFREAARLGPVLPQDRYNLGGVLAEMGQPAEALQQFEALLTLGPPTAELHFNAGVLCAQLGRAPAAIDHFRRALSLDPNYPGARENLSRLEARLGPPPSR